MNKSVKLTKPQMALLGQRPCTCSDTYAPARRLVALGLARWEPQMFGDLLVPALPTNTPSEETPSTSETEERG